jgi:hypothetical protein
MSDRVLTCLGVSRLASAGGRPLRQLHRPATPPLPRPRELYPGQGPASLCGYGCCLGLAASRRQEGTNHPFDVAGQGFQVDRQPDPAPAPDPQAPKTVDAMVMMARVEVLMTVVVLTGVNLIHAGWLAPGVVLAAPTPEEIAEQWSTVTDLTGGREFDGGAAEQGDWVLSQVSTRSS